MVENKVARFMGHCVERKCKVDNMHEVWTYRQYCIFIHHKYTKYADTNRLSIQTTQKYIYLPRNITTCQIKIQRYAASYTDVKLPNKVT